MADDRPSRAAGDGGAPFIDPALTEALDDLEKLLRESSDEQGIGFEEPAGSDTIPVLSPVATRTEFGDIPPLPGPSRDAHEADGPLASGATQERDRARLERVVDRLVSEIDIIAADCVAQALAQVERDVQALVRERVAKHLQIVLPDLLDDMSN